MDELTAFLGENPDAVREMAVNRLHRDIFPESYQDDWDLPDQQTLEIALGPVPKGSSLTQKVLEQINTRATSCNIMK
jgi:hypothetical protein